MDRPTILQIHDHSLDVDASIGVYQEATALWGFRDAHTQLLHELRTWTDTAPAPQSDPEQRIERALDVEREMLIDTGVAGVAVEHLPFLYSVLREVFEDYGETFRQALRNEAQHVERQREEALHKQMRDTGCDRFEATPYMESAALERLENRREHVLAIFNAHRMA